jgi:hypothetical protein
MSSSVSLTCFESLHSAGGIENLFVTSKKWVAVTAYFDIDFLHSRTNMKSVPASAGNGGIHIILWVNLGFHVYMVTYLDFFSKGKAPHLLASEGRFETASARYFPVAPCLGAKHHITGRRNAVDLPGEL